MTPHFRADFLDIDVGLDQELRQFFVFTIRVLALVQGLEEVDRYIEFLNRHVADAVILDLVDGATKQDAAARIDVKTPYGEARGSTAWRCGGRLWVGRIGRRGGCRCVVRVLLTFQQDFRFGETQFRFVE